MNGTALAAVTETVVSGSLLVAIPIAVAAGLVSFLSPCVLPLVPAYLSYVTGLVGVDLGDARRGRLFAGTSLFVLGFTVVFVSFGALFGGLGALLLQHADVITRLLGALTIVFGLAFMGLVPWLNRSWHPQKRASFGLAGAPVLGVLFGIGWTPCIGPTLAAVETLAVDQASAARGALLTFAYCIGLGIPFLVVALAFRRTAGGIAFIKRHYVGVMRLGGGMLVVLGVLMVTGAWDQVAVQLRIWTSSFGTAL
ncbi:MAG: cytochrome c biogenesis protein CcdA [Actinomycetes bacterium]